jgi:hypothetical protein
MLAAIPHQGGHTVAFGETGALQSGRKLARTTVKIAIGVTVARPVWVGGDNLNVGEQLARPVEDAGDQQRGRHHG